MARGMFRGVAVAWGSLIVLQAVTTTRGAGAVGGMFGAVDDLVKRALDPGVPAIPDHSTAASTGNTDADGNFHPNVPDYLGGGSAGGTKKTNPKKNPNVVPYDPPPPGGWPSGGQPRGQLDDYRVPGIPSTTSTA
jgi:hypothetical protein